MLGTLASTVRGRVLLQHGSLGAASMAQLLPVLAAVSCGRCFSSKAHRQGGKQAKKQQQQRQRPPQQGSSSSSKGGSGPSPWPRPAPLVLPERKAAAPAVGRVPPSSRAAAAAAAAVMSGARQLPSPPAIAGTAAAAAAAASAAAAAAEAEAADAAAAAAVQPWDVVAALPRSSPYSLERMADMSLSTYLCYLSDTRLGMASIFELGVTREQGRAGRCQLLRRETLLRCLAEQLLGAPVAAGASGRAALEQLRDEQLAEATRAQLADAAEAAAGASYVAAAATADEVGDCVMDVFVMRRCMQLMLLQRQERELLAVKHAMLQQQQQQHGSGCGGGPPAALNALNTQDVSIWDAFFDADLLDYGDYLRAGAAGAPTVFTAVNPHADSSSSSGSGGGGGDSKQGPRTLHGEQLREARRQLRRTAALLGRLPAGMRRRPTLLLGCGQLAQLSALSGVAMENVVSSLEDFYRLKRIGFRAALEELLAGADEGGGPSGAAARLA